MQKKVIDGFDNLPFSFKDSYKDSDSTIHLYIEIKDNGGKLEEIKYGFICLHERKNHNYYANLRSNYGMDKIYVVLNQEELKVTHEGIDHFSLTGLSRMLSEYKDIWYQSNILF